MTVLQKIGLMVLIVCVGACAGDEAVKAPSSRSGDIFQQADQDDDGMLSYPEFRHYADLEARGQGADAMNRRMAEMIAGNSELHKRFIFLDADNNGRISRAEIER